MDANKINWSQLLEDAVRKPGSILEAYSNFHNYSIGNCMLAALQCAARKIPLGPIATYKRWQELGRQVQRGSKALTLCMPKTIKKTVENPAGEDEEHVRTYFTFDGGIKVIHLRRFKRSTSFLSNQSEYLVTYCYIPAYP